MFYILGKNLDEVIVVARLKINVGTYHKVSASTSELCLKMYNFYLQEYRIDFGHTYFQPLENSNLAIQCPKNAFYESLEPPFDKPLNLKMLCRTTSV